MMLGTAHPTHHRSPARAASIAIPVVMLTRIVMPNLTRFLDAGLHAGTDAIH
jgi:hypothetical protein